MLLCLPGMCLATGMLGDRHGMHLSLPLCLPSLSSPSPTPYPLSAYPLSLPTIRLPRLASLSPASHPFSQPSPASTFSFSVLLPTHTTCPLCNTPSAHQAPSLLSPFSMPFTLHTPPSHACLYTVHFCMPCLLHCALCWLHALSLPPLSSVEIWSGGWDVLSSLGGGGEESFDGDNETGDKTGQTGTDSRAYMRRILWREQHARRRMVLRRAALTFLPS